MRPQSSAHNHLQPSAETDTGDAAERIGSAGGVLLESTEPGICQRSIGLLHKCPVPSPFVRGRFRNAPACRKRSSALDSAAGRCDARCPIAVLIILWSPAANLIPNHFQFQCCRHIGNRNLGFYVLQVWKATAGLSVYGRNCDGLVVFAAHGVTAPSLVRFWPTTTPMDDLPPSLITFSSSLARIIVLAPTSSFLAFPEPTKSGLSTCSVHRVAGRPPQPRTVHPYNGLQSNPSIDKPPVARTM